jgi:hypothetical protein
VLDPSVYFVKAYCARNGVTRRERLVRRAPLGPDITALIGAAQMRL